ncbi:major facilitator superfamily domain-containing protein [Xylaria curta]|nr:major facilitator superfamily domain-containing protein [Xylaria curta]
MFYHPPLFFGRRPVLLSSVGCIPLGSGLSGFAKTPTWLFVTRAISGIGSGGISSSVAIIVSDLVSLKARGKYQGMISLAIGARATSGPFGQKLRKIDWLGVITSVVGVVLTLLAINSGGLLWPWTSGQVLLTLIIGGILFFVFIVIEAYLTIISIMLLRLFTTWLRCLLLMIGFLSDSAWQATQYFVPLYFQTPRGYTPLQSVTLILPFVAAQGIADATSGPVMFILARYSQVLRTGLLFWTLSLVALQVNAGTEDRAVVTGTRNVLRSLGGVVGAAISLVAKERVLQGIWHAGDKDTMLYEPERARLEGFRVIFANQVPLVGLCLLASFFVADVVIKGDAEKRRPKIKIKRSRWFRT